MSRHVTKFLPPFVSFIAWPDQQGFLDLFTYGNVFCRTFKQDCPVQIKLRASLNGKSLEVKSFERDHNHEVSKVIFFCLCYMFLVLIDNTVKITTCSSVCICFIRPYQYDFMLLRLKKASTGW